MRGSGEPQALVSAEALFTEVSAAACNTAFDPAKVAVRVSAAAATPATATPATAAATAAATTTSAASTTWATCRG